MEELQSELEKFKVKVPSIEIVRYVQPARICDNL